MMLDEGKRDCDKGCLGYGDCVKACLFDALENWTGRVSRRGQGKMCGVRRL
jgi:hypothetical protein